MHKDKIYLLFETLLFSCAFSKKNQDAC